MQRVDLGGEFITPAAVVDDVVGDGQSRVDDFFRWADRLLSR